MCGIAVLMYHALEDEAHPAGSIDAGEHIYVVHADRFREQMSYLRREGFRTFLLPELLTLADWPGKAVVLTFDDGHASNSTLALPILDQYGFKAHFFITTDWLDTPRFLTLEQVRELHRAGMGIGSHGCSHRFLNDLGRGEAERELRVSREALAGITGAEITAFSAPGGRVGPEHAALARSLGYRFLYTSHSGLFRRDGDVMAIPRLAVRADTDLAGFMAMAHGDRRYLGRMRRREKLFSLARKALGNAGYEAVRKILLKDRTWNK